jgi:putative Mg2+ transporter-C (MgtC) family protein
VELGSQLQLILEVGAAMLLGGIVGFERELADKPAGLRTHMITAGASALLVGLSNTLVEEFANTGNAVEADPIRVIQAIIIGISFIGAGTIFRRADHAHVEGLTTAAALLVSAGLGIAAALQQYVAAAAIAVLSLIILRVMKMLGDRISGRAKE